MSSNEFNDDLPGWAGLLEEGSDGTWYWSNNILIHIEAAADPIEAPTVGRLRRWLLDVLYAAQNRTRNVRQALEELLHWLPADAWGINFGAGSTKFHQRIINVDLFRAPGMDVVMRGSHLPFSDGSVSLVISQEVLEHMSNPQEVVGEVHRVLCSGGRFYCQVPFVFGYHAGPKDYWRFSKDGLQQLFDDSQWRILSTRRTVGHGTGMYRIAVEFMAVTVSVIHRRLYIPSKAAASIVLWPLTWFDVLTDLSSEPDRISGGYFCVAEKIK